MYYTYVVWTRTILFLTVLLSRGVIAGINYVAQQKQQNPSKKIVGK